MFDALIGPALSFGSSLLSGLGARQSAKKQQKLQAAYEYQNYLLQVERNNINRQRGIELVEQFAPSRVAVDAERAGFNPATWLGAMGGMYASMTQYGHQLQIGQDYFQNAPTAQVPSGLEVFGGALNAGVNTWLADRRVQQSQDFQREILQTQISAIQRNGGKPLSIGSRVAPANTTFFGSGNLPFAVSAGSQRTTLAAPGLSVKPPELPSGQSVLVGDEVKNPSPFQAQGWYSHPRWPGAQAVGDAYHEEGPVVFTYGNFFKPYVDAKYNWDIYKHMGVNIAGVSITPADRNQLGYYPDGARGISWGRPNGSGSIHSEPPKANNRIGWPGTPFYVEW